MSKRIFLPQNLITSNRFVKNARMLPYFVTLGFTFCVSLASSASANLNLQFPLQTEFKNVDLSLRAKVAQKLMIDLRYYCAPKAQGYCQQAMLSLPPELSQMLARAKVGGVILFAENLASSAQILQLNHDIQQTAQALVLAPKHETDSTATASVLPLYLGIDQEGGRVSRLPQNEFLGFAGNMAIGATHYQYKNQFASATSQRTAQYLQILGFNVNFAPVLDVNNNPENPIINVRAYSQSPKIVAQLGGATIIAMQEYGISVAAKHFPGHGDTVIDSHVGLPAVKHSKELINSIDLYPFRAVIGDNKTRPDMIMTAHIQYPKLDDTPFIIDNNPAAEQEQAQVSNNTVLPATLSRKILTGILREQLAYTGLIITDALDMASITSFLNPAEAVIKSFEAGADITLMPYQISSPEDAIDFLDWLNQLTIYISHDDDLVASVNASYDRIVAHKKKRKLNQWAQLPLKDKQVALTQFTQDTEQRNQDEDLALSLSAASFTQLKGLSEPLSHTQRILAVMPDKLRCQAFEQYWFAYVNSQTQGQVDTQKGALSCVSLLSEAIPLATNGLQNLDVLIVGNATPALGFYESRGFEGIEANQRLDPERQLSELDILIAQANEQDVTTVLLQLRSPYIAAHDVKNFDAIYASYDYQVIPRAQAELTEENTSLLRPYFSPVFDTFIKVLSGQESAKGHLPVMLQADVKKLLPLPPPSANETQAPVEKVQTDEPAKTSSPALEQKLKDSK